mgnify:CR=1 FL=1
MAVLLLKETMNIVDPQLLRTSWQKERIPNSSIDSTLKAASSIPSSNFIIQIEMLKSLIVHLDEEELNNLKVLSSLFEITRWRLQGTDGVRAIVDSKEVDSHQALIEFTHHNTLTPKFCYLYITSFIEMARSHPLYKNITHIAFGEDGRDYYQGSPLKKSIHQALSDMGIVMVDIGIIPTPYIAQYSIEHHGLAIMLTASHNPSFYNGIKLFVDGKKLYPEGEMGEYALSSLVLQHSMGGKRRGTPFIPSISFDQQSLYEKDLTRACKAISNSIFDTCPLLVDCANGGASAIFTQTLSLCAIPHIPIACTPELDTINKDSGVALLEDIHQHLNYDKGLPTTIQKLFSEARERNAHRAFAIVLDGDGDRSFLLQYIKEKNDDKVVVYNGDSLGYLITLLHIGKNEQKPLFVNTIESDFSLQSKMKKDLLLDSTYTCVGDRWVVDAIDKSTGYGIGCEKSGHVVFPLPVKNGQTLYSGNGMLTALYALSYLLENNFPLPLQEGYNNKEVIRGNIIHQFYRQSPLWREIYSAIIPLLNWEYKEKTIENEPHLLCISLIDQDEEIGWFYMRKSGTEEKMSYILSLLLNYKEEGENLMGRMKEKISFICSSSQK